MNSILFYHRLLFTIEKQMFLLRKKYVASYIYFKINYATVTSKFVFQKGVIGLDLLSVGRSSGEKGFVFGRGLVPEYNNTFCITR